MEVVLRVCEAYGRGIPIEQALAAERNEKVNIETWKKALQSNPEFSPHWAGARGKFLADSMAKLAGAKNLKFLCWILERRHSDLFAKRDGKPSDVTPDERERSTEIPEDILQRAHQLAKGGQAHG